MIRRHPRFTRLTHSFPTRRSSDLGCDWLKPLVATILARGQDVQLHLHPNLAWAKAGDGGAAHSRFEMVEHSAHEQRDLIAGAIDLLKAAGAPHPIAFRAGSYVANDETLAALAALGFVYDSSHNGAATPWPSRIGLPADTIAPEIGRASCRERVCQYV